MPRRTARGVAPWLLSVPLLAWAFASPPAVDPLGTPVRAQEAGEVLDPAGWGSDHVGKPVPDYMTGDECLFCHRTKVGPSWSSNVHQTALRLVMKDDPGLQALGANLETAELAKMVEFVLGGETQTRYLRRAKGYGKLDLLSVAWGGGKLVHTDNPSWDLKQFGSRCAGCHATGVDSKRQTFSATSIDCFACHGLVELGHTKDTRLVHLSRKRADLPRVVASLCGQCHIRHGISRSTGLPFANNFVAGDNLFRDMKVDLAPAFIAGLAPGDRHVIQNMRDMVAEGAVDTTCLSCHDIHGQSTEKHQELDDQALCFVCHTRAGPRSEVRPYRRHSSRCGY